MQGTESWFSRYCRPLGISGTDRGVTDHGAVDILVIAGIVIIVYGIDQPCIDVVYFFIIGGIGRKSGETGSSGLFDLTFPPADLFPCAGVIRHKFNPGAVDIALAAADAPERLWMIVKDKMIDPVHSICIGRIQVNGIFPVRYAGVDGGIQCLFGCGQLLVVVGITAVR